VYSVLKLFAVICIYNLLSVMLCTSITNKEVYVETVVNSTYIPT